MVDKIVGIFITALVVTGVGIALRKDAPTANVIRETLSGFANIQRASFGPK